jgi:hypothetical protein
MSRAEVLQNSPRLDKQGYVLKLQGWMGRLGNHIIQLSCALHVAEQSRSQLLIPEHGTFRKRAYDFRDASAENCNEVISGPFFLQSDCYQFPIRYDHERRRVLLNHVRTQMMHRSLRGRIKDLIRPEPDTKLDEETLVINMRSGSDIFRSDPPPQNDYMQPPLSFYRYIIEKHNYRKCLIVTEPERENPVINALLSWKDGPEIRIKKHRSVQNDVLTVLNARHLIAAHSTFTWCLALMSNRLVKYHQPFTCRIRGITDFFVQTYEYDNYIRPGEWMASREQLRWMVEHPVGHVRVQEANVGPDPPLSSCW